jgi:hypothetical protein
VSEKCEAVSREELAEALSQSAMIHLEIIVFLE